MVVLRARDLEAVFEPAYGMICASLRHRGEELLAERRGLEEYKRSAATMGIPLLHPWANRLGASTYAFGGREVAVEGSRVDEHGLPIHGLPAALRGWETVEESDARLVAGRDVRGLASFPFDHRIEVAASLEPDRLRIDTTLTAFDAPVPICFGHHPYLRLPGVPRADWELTVPVRERLLLDERAIPTGEREPAPNLDGPLGARTFDDAFTAGDGRFAVEGGGRRHRGRVRARLPVRATVRAGQPGRGLLRADDRAGRRAAARAGLRRARRVVHGVVQRPRLRLTGLRRSCRRVRSLTFRAVGGSSGSP